MKVNGSRYAILEDKGRDDADDLNREDDLQRIEMVVKRAQQMYDANPHGPTANKSVKQRNGEGKDRVLKDASNLLSVENLRNRDGSKETHKKSLRNPQGQTQRNLKENVASVLKNSSHYQLELYNSSDQVVHAGSRTNF